MFRTTVICGSSNKHGFSNHICERIKHCCESANAECNAIYPSDMTINHCSGCDSCTDGICIIDDDMTEVLNAVKESDVIFFVIPIHFSGPSSLMKTVIDRFQPFWFHSGMLEQKTLVPVLCGGSNNPCFTYTEGILRAFSATTRMHLTAPLEISGTDSMCPKDTDSCVEAFVRNIIKVQQVL